MSKALVECSFDGLSGACDENHFNWVYNKNYGNCYVINSGFTQSGEPEDTVISSYAGKEYGLTITMFLGVRKELRFLDPNHGLILKIDNRSNGIIQDPIEIPAGYETNIAIEREFTKQLANPFSNCDLDYDDPISFDKKYHDALAEINIKYEQSVCFQYCYQTMLKQKCNCSDRDINSFFDLANCYSDSEFKCLNDIYHQFVFGTYLNDMCKPFCPLECNKTRFNIKTSSTKLNIDYYSSLIENFAIFTSVISLFSGETLSQEEKANSIIKFNIYYDSLAYKITTESKAMDMVALLSNIGGTLGLFLGVSVLTIVELLDIALQVLVIALKNN